MVGTVTRVLLAYLVALAIVAVIMSGCNGPTPSVKATSVTIEDAHEFHVLLCRCAAELSTTQHLSVEMDGFPNALSQTGLQPKTVLGRWRVIAAHDETSHTGDVVLQVHLYPSASQMNQSKSYETISWGDYLVAVEYVGEQRALYDGVKMHLSPKE